MRIWRLIAHHAIPDRAIDWSIESGRIAVGWAMIGDLRELRCESARDISSLIRAAYPNDVNAHTGGPSLWNFFAEMQIGDLVIVARKGRRYHVVEVTGPYVWVSAADSFDEDYLHQRSAVMTTDDPDKLWASVGGVADGQSVRWTVSLCASETPSLPGIMLSQRYLEGTKYDIIASGKERNRKAREACILHHGCNCAVCGLKFEERYGDIGREFIHVHHKRLLASAEGEREVDPVEDLIPLCPNCHAMVHRCDPPLEVENLKQRLSSESGHNPALNRTDTALSRGPAG